MQILTKRFLVLLIKFSQKTLVINVLKVEKNLKTLQLDDCQIFGQILLELIQLCILSFKKQNYQK